MKQNVYSIYDTVAEIFNKPFFDHNHNTAMRGFRESVQEQVHKNDYVLYHLGEYTDHDGVLKPNKAPEKLMTGFDVNASLENQAT